MAMGTFGIYRFEDDCGLCLHEELVRVRAMRKTATQMRYFFMSFLPFDTEGMNRKKVEMNNTHVSSITDRVSKKFLREEKMMAK
jgi:hypothetical protein